jgi:hypothetical protein
MGVAGDEGVGEVELIPVNRYEASFEADMPGFYRFYLGSGQYQAGLIVLEEAVIEGCAAIGGKNGHRHSIHSWLK